MDERTLKRLPIILVSRIIAIVLFKAGMARTYTALDKAAASSVGETR